MRFYALFLGVLLGFSPFISAQTTFSGSKTATLGDSFVVTGDFNLDGIPDLAIAQDTVSPDTNGVAILLGNASGTYSSFTGAVVPGEINQLEVADVNRDGKLDLLLNISDGSAVAVLLGNGDGTFTRSADVNIEFQPGGFATGDFNNDGFPDLAIHDCEEVQFPFCTVAIFLNDRTGHFTKTGTITPVSASSANASSQSIVIADLNSDGRQDLVFLDQDGFEVAIGNGDGTFLTPMFTAARNPDGIAIGSFNHDLKLDLAIVTVNDCPTCATNQTAHEAVYLNDGTGHFGLRSRVLLETSNSFQSAPITLLVTDINGDRIADLVTTTDKGIVQYSLGHGDGTFAAPVQVAQVTNANGTAARDLNGDGRHDLVVSSGTDGFAHILKNNNATVNCRPPSSARLGVHLCSPVGGQTTAKTFTVSASGNSPAGITRLELWVDGKKRTESIGDQLRSSVTVSSGRHRVAIVAVDPTGTTTGAVSITAQ